MLGLYLHWPFCLSKCSYCDFVSCADLTALPQYAEALKKEIVNTGRLYRETADTVYIGGGTPSVARAELLKDLLGTVRNSFALQDSPEITVEANPGTLSFDWLDEMHKAGVNRLSMGLQSSSPLLLERLGRRHSPEEFVTAFRAARRAGFDNLSVDLIYGIPGQTPEDWMQTLQFTCGLQPEHISVYSLTLEEGTRLAQQVQTGRLPAPDEDLAADMYAAGAAYLAQQGFRRYEISNFARPGKACRHNLRYWRLEDYLGLGTAAHSMIRHLRFANTDNTENYIRALNAGKYPLKGYEFITPAEREREFFMLTTRCAAGFSPGEYTEITGRVWRQENRAGLDSVLSEGLLHVKDGRFVPTDRGFLFQNRLAALLMEDVPEVP